MEKLETKYAELDEFLTHEASVFILTEHLTDLRVLCTSVFMRSLIKENESAPFINEKVLDQLHYLNRIIEIFSNIKNN